MSVPTLNLDMINRLFTNYPEYADKAVLSIKGGPDLKTLAPNGSPEKSHSDNIASLAFHKSPIERTVAALGEPVKEGLIGGISLSEVKPETIRRAAAVHKISAVEIEYSLWSTEARELGVLSTCAELGIPVIVYSPLGRGPDSFKKGFQRRL
ncbi:NADP-dependent oxidoreductase domain-containing protein [Lipomyces starkeyi]